jgi:hypothetical protein
MSGEPRFVGANILTEARSHEDVSAVNLGEVDGGPKLSQISVAELECRKPDAFEALGVPRLVERQVTPALRNEEVGSDRARGSVEERVETSLSLKA